MAANKKTELTIEYKAVNSQFNQALKDINSEVNTLNKEFRLQAETMKRTASDTEKYQTKVSKLKNELGFAKQKTEETNKAYDKAVELMGENSKEAQMWKNKLLDAQRAEAVLENAIADTNEQLEKATEEEKKLADNIEKANVELSQQADEAKKTSKSLTEIGESIQETGDKISGVGESMSVGLTAPIMAVGAAAHASWLEYDDAIDGIITATGASGEAVEGFEKVFNDVFTSLPVDADKVGAAIGELNTQFALTGEDLAQATEQMVKFSEITGSDVVASTQGAKKTMELFKMDVFDLPDVLDRVAKTAQDTGISTDQLFASIQKGAPQIQGLGLGFSQGATMIGQFEQAGIDSTKALSLMGRAQGNFAKEGKTLEDGLAKLQEKLQGTGSDTKKLSILTEVFGTKGAPFMLQALDTGAVKFDELRISAGDATDTVANTFEETRDPIDGFTTAFNNLKAIGSELAGMIQEMLAPAIKGMVAKLQELKAYFDGLSEEQKQQIIKIAGIVAAIGPLLIIIGKVTSGVGKMFENLDKLKTVISGISAPMAIAVIAIGALVAGFIHAYQTSEEFRNKVHGLLTKMQEFASNVYEAIQVNVLPILASLKDGLQSAFGTVMENVVKPAIESFKVILGGIVDVITSVVTYISNFKDSMNLTIPILAGLTAGLIAFKTAMLISSLINSVKTALLAFKAATEGMTIAQKLLNLVMNMNPFAKVAIVIGLLVTAGVLLYKNWDTVKAKAQELWNKIRDTWESIKTKTTNTWNNIKESIMNPINRAKETVTSTIDNIKNKVTGVWDSIKSYTTEKWNAIKSAVTGPIDKAREAVKTAVDRIKSIFDFKWQWPSIKLPRFTVSGSLNPLKWAKEGKPRIGLTWEQHADGFMVNRPTFLGMTGNVGHIGGEAGAEALLPLNSNVLGQIGQGIFNATSDLVALVGDTLTGSNDSSVYVTMNNIISSDYDSDKAISKLDEGLGRLGIRKNRARGGR